MIETCCLLPRQQHGRGKARLSYDGGMDPECLQIVDFVSLRGLFGWMRQRVLSEFHDWDARSLTTCWPPRPEPRVARARAHFRKRGFVTFPRPLSSDSSITADPASKSFRKVETTSEAPAKPQRLDQMLRVTQLELLHERSRVPTLTSIHQQSRNVGVNPVSALQPFSPNRPDETK